VGRSSRPTPILANDLLDTDRFNPVDKVNYPAVNGGACSSSVQFRLQ
jgi:hypothetical protein